MRGKRNFFVGLIWGSLLSVSLWISLLGWVKIGLSQYHQHKGWLIQFWNQ